MGHYEGNPLSVGQALNQKMVDHQVGQSTLHSDQLQIGQEVYLGVLGQHRCAEGGYLETPMVCIKTEH